MKGTIRNMTALPQPILATTIKGGGRLVQIVALGDVEGQSPSCWIVDDQGRIEITSTEQFRVLDAHFLPPNSNTFTEFAQAVRK